MMLFVDIVFLALCSAISFAPVYAWSGLRARLIWCAWVILWGLPATLFAYGTFALDPVVLRLPLFFGGQIAVGLLAFAAFPALRRAIRAVPLAWVVGWQQARVIGGAFLIGAVLGAVSWPFAIIAGLGDMAVGLSARRARRNTLANPHRAVELARAHSRHGLLDFLIAIATALVTGANIGWPYALIPLFLVPMAVLAHLVTLDPARNAAPVSG